jgi:hypothetical protein
MWVPLTNVVARATQFSSTTEPLTKSVPSKSKTRPADPNTTFEGDMEVSIGSGYPAVNADGKEVPPPGGGVRTLKCTVPAVAISAGTNETNRLALLTYVVGRALALYWTTEDGTKLLPFTVTTTGLEVPTVAVGGTKELTAGSRRRIHHGC